ncbi:MAG: hypothetical protein RIQ52_972 [Pseudomonadota bacterium]
MSLNTLVSLLPVLLGFLSGICQAWEDATALAFIQQHHPVLNAQQTVLESLHEPDAWQTLANHTHLTARLGMGAVPLIGNNDTTSLATLPMQGPTAYGGIILSLPMGSPERGLALNQQRLQQAEAEMRVMEQVLQDLMELHRLEENLHVRQSQIKTLESDIRLGIQRIEAGLSPLDPLPVMRNNLYQQRTQLAQQSVILSAWQHKYSRHAGTQWKILLDYLQGNLAALPETPE